MTHLQLDYGVTLANPARGLDGIFTQLPERLARQLTFDGVQVECVGHSNKASKRATLWFRSGAKRIFHVRVLRKSGRYLVEMGGVDPATVLDGISICRNHFDAWFGITTDDIQSEQAGGPNHPDGCAALQTLTESRL